MRDLKPMERKIAMLLDASEGMTTEEAVKYLKHGQEMEHVLKLECRACEYNGGAGVSDCSQALCSLRDILAKLDKD